MADETDEYAAAREALKGLIASIARTSAQATHALGVEFDVDDPRVARWLILATFEGMFTLAAKTTQAELLKRAAEASEPEIEPRRRKASKHPLVTWDDLVATAALGGD